MWHTVHAYGSGPCNVIKCNRYCMTHIWQFLTQCIQLQCTIRCLSHTIHFTPVQIWTVDFSWTGKCVSHGQFLLPKPMCGRNPRRSVTKHLALSFPVLHFLLNQQYMNWRIKFKKQVSYYICKSDTVCMFFQKKHYIVLECVQRHVQENL